MKKHKVIDRNCLPTRPPWLLGVILWLVLDRVQSPGWLTGVAWTIYAVLVIGWAMVVLKEDEVKVPGFGQKDGDA